MLQRIGADSGVDSNGDFPQARALSRYLDQKQGMEMRLNALSQLWRLSRFVGMLTDSRSFLSYPRHEYFRRILCGLIGADVAAGLIPADEAALGKLVRDICHDNAVAYFGLEHGRF